MLIASLLPVIGACGSAVKSKKDQSDSAQNFSCVKNNPDLCQVDEKIASLQKELQVSLNKQDKIRASAIQIEINFLTESKGVEREEDLLALQSKYDVLRLIYADELRMFKEKGFVSAEQMNAYQEGLYEGPNFTSSYHPLVLAEVKKVFNDFGDLYVNEHKIKDGKYLHKAVISEKRPWSGYWYPVTNKSLYEGENSPLRKLDKVLKMRGISSNIADREALRYKGYVADGWEGLCDGLAVASAMTDEPTATKIVEGIEFSIGDQKALATYTHVGWPVKQYGISYQGNAETDGTYQDLKPEGFHRIVTHVLGVEKRALVVDDTAGVQVWNKPLYRYSWVIEKDPKLSYAFLVKGYPWLMKERQEESDRLTSQRDIVAPIYTYRLYVDKSQSKNGKYKVVAGQWTERSYVDHPDTVTYPLKEGKLQTHNPEFNKYLQEYQELFLNAQ